MLGHKTSLKTGQDTNPNPSNFSDQNSETQEIKYMGEGGRRYIQVGGDMGKSMADSC